MAPEDDERADLVAACGFVEALVRASQSYGVSSHGMLTSLARVVQALGLHGEFLATPNYVQSVLWGKDEHRQRVHLAVSRSGNYDLGKLARVMRVAESVAAGSVSPGQGMAQLREIGQAPDAYAPPFAAASFVVCAVAFAALLGASWMDALAGGVAALGSYGVTLLAARSVGVSTVQESVAAMWAVVFGCAAAAVLPDVHPIAVAVCAAVSFVPGFALTIAPNELVFGNTLSGITWFANGLVTALKLLGGAAVGVAIAEGVGLGPATASPGDGIAAAWRWAAAPALVLALAVLMKADRRSLGGILLGGLLVWAAMQLGAPFGAWQGTFFGAAALIVYGAWYAQRTSVPTVVILLPCVMVLVPGLVALRAIDVVEKQGLVAGFQAVRDVMVLVAALIGGAFVGDAIVLHLLVRTGEAVRTLIGIATGPRGDDRAGTGGKA